MKKTFLLAIIIITIIGCGSNKDREPISTRKIKVTTAKVLAVSDKNNYTYSGTVEAFQTIPLTFKTAGTVENVYVEVGDVVREGQLIASIDNTDMLNIYNTMLAKYEQAKDAYDRLEMVYDQGSLPEIKWVGIKSDIEQAKSSFDLAKNNLKKCNMYASINGIVGSRNIEPGQSSISLTSTPIELVRIEKVYVKISVPENEIIKIQKGQKTSFTVSALDEKKFEGTVSNVSPVADVISRTYTVKILVENPGMELKPGMVCDVALKLETEKKLLVIPNTAVSKDIDGKTFVYLVSTDNTKVKKQYITVGRFQHAGIEVISGLTEGQTVVVMGCDKLSDNSLISI